MIMFLNPMTSVAAQFLENKSLIVIIFDNMAHDTGRIDTFCFITIVIIIEKCISFDHLYLKNTLY